MTPEQYLKIRNDLYDKVSKLRLDISDARDKAEKCKIPENLRPATPADIVIDAIIWYPKEIGDGFERDYWCIVDEVLHPNDLFKAYESDGCRMGLDGAYVEIKPPTQTNETIATEPESTMTRYYLCTTLSEGNKYNNTVLNISPIDYIISMLPEPLAIINVLEITEDEYNKIADIQW